MYALVSALDWGLGHTTRIIPVISKLKDRNYKIIIVGTEKQFSIYRNYFPDENYENIAEFDIKYSKGDKQVKTILLQTPKFLHRIRNERKTIKSIIKKYPTVQLIVSDNCYGFTLRKIYSVIICHQLNICSPKRINWLQPTLNRIHTRFLDRFDEIWVPDNVSLNNISGKLSYPKKQIRGKIRFIGILSRFSLSDIKCDKAYEYDYLFLISGPETQRTIFENLLIKELQKISPEPQYLIVRGKPESSEKLDGYNAVNHLKDEELIIKILSSKKIVCRSGYSTVMDLIHLKKTALLIPTPDQPEQEYLAEYLSDKKWFSSVDQKDYSHENLLEQQMNFEFTEETDDESLLQDAIQGLTGKVEKRYNNR